MSLTSGMMALALCSSVFLQSASFRSTEKKLLLTIGPVYARTLRPRRIDKSFHGFPTRRRVCGGGKKKKKKKKCEYYFVASR